MDKIKELQAFALANYDAGGHWVYETHDPEDYTEILAQCGGDVDAGKAEIKARWELTNEMAANCRFE